MIRLIEALNYRCLRYVKQPLGDFHVLVGPNASGKTTFLDVIAFLGDLVSDGLDKAIEKRTSLFDDLLFRHKGERFELAIELEIPQKRREMLGEQKYSSVRYEVAIGWAREAQEIHLFDEQVLLYEEPLSDEPATLELFPRSLAPPSSIMTPRHKQKGQRQGRRLAVSKNYGGNDNYYSEVHKKGGKGWAPSYRLGPRKSALTNMPEDERMLPVSTWLRSFLVEGVENLVLNSQEIRHSSPPGRGRRFKPDGSNLPWVINNLMEDSPERHRDWVSHLSTALKDLKDIETVELPDTRSRFLRLVYSDGFKVPSWMESDGTLRLLALTLPAYLTDIGGIYLIEEPENGIHPMAMETVFNRLVQSTRRKSLWRHILRLS